MNKQRRTQLDQLQNRLTALNLPTVFAELSDISAELETLRDEEQDAFDNLPESLQAGDKGQAMSDAIDAMDAAVSSLNGCEPDELFNEVFALIEDAKGQA
jgi:hypothetical protein